MFENKYLNVFVVILVVAFGYNQWSKYHLAPDLPFFSTRFKNESGKEFEGSQWKGKYILVSYFQSWCRDCAMELPSINLLQQNVGKEKLEVVLLSDEGYEKINKFRNYFKSELPYFQTETSFKQLGIHVFPTTYLIDKEGKILLSKLEGYNWAGPDVLQLIK